MFVNPQQPENGPYYTLGRYEDGEKIRMVNYGSNKPLFYQPDLRLGFCEDELETVADESVDLLIDDPPYGTTLAEWDEEPNWSELAEEYHRVLKDDGQVVVFGKQPSLIPVFNEFTDSGFDFRFELIWKKQNNPWVSDQQPIPIHENIFVFKKSATKVGELTFNTEQIRRDGVFVCPRCEAKDRDDVACPECGEDISANDLPDTDPTVRLGGYTQTRTNEGKSETQGGWQEVYETSQGEDRHPISFLDRDVLEYTSVGGWSDEYTGYAGQKPLDLLSWLVTAMSERGDRVLDPHMGSASTPMACIPLCRESVGFEADPQRFKTAEERVEDLLDGLRGLKHADVQPAEQRATEAVTGGDG